MLNEISLVMLPNGWIHFEWIQIQAYIFVLRLYRFCDLNLNIIWKK